MKLLRIRLHPFGASSDRTLALGDGLNLIEGPNEFGKSTLQHALWHALFTPSNLTPAKLRDTMGRWFPKPSGDHCRVTLEFEADGKKWTLHKCWGAGASSSLQAGGGAPAADPGGVQETLRRLLHRNEATWKHVLFLNQAGLARTIETLRDSAKEIDDPHPLLAGAAAIPGDVPAQKLLDAVDARIKEHYSHWDIAAGRPERGRGIDNPWAKEVGPLLAAFYKMETVRRELLKVADHEQTVDRLNSEIRSAEAEAGADREFVSKYQGLRGGLARGQALRERIGRLEEKVNHLRGVMTEWPAATQKIEFTRQAIADLDSASQKLGEELSNARKRESATQLRAAHDRLVKARHDWQQAAAKLAESKPIPAGSLEELQRLARRAKDLEIQIAAQKLTARMESKAPVEVLLTRGNSPAETITLRPGSAWSGEAEGRLAIEAGDFKVEVFSGTGDGNALFSELSHCAGRSRQILAGLGFENLAAAEAADKLHKELAQAEATARHLYESARLGKPEEEWAAEISALNALPETRSVRVLEEEERSTTQRKAALEAEVKQIGEKVAAWVKEFTDADTLTNLILTETQTLNAAKKEAQELPALPEGFQSVAEFFAELDARSSRLEESAEAIKNLKIELGALLKNPPERTAEELREELEAAGRDFARCREEGEALRRIRDKIEAIEARRGAIDPLKGLEKSVGDHFRSLTCQAYQTVRLAGTAPVEVSGRLVLEPAALSQGTLGSLALATRLALAEVYLRDMPGFLILDDPFTDMDPARRRAAGECLSAFAAKHQVIFFTCHPEHAADLEKHTPARRVAVAG